MLKNKDRKKVLKTIVELFDYCKKEKIIMYLTDKDRYIYPYEKYIIELTEDNRDIVLMRDEYHPQIINLIDFNLAYNAFDTYTELMQEFLEFSCAFSKNVDKQVLEHFKI